VLSCGLIGRPLGGKTTLFNLLTGARRQTSQFMMSSGQAAQGIMTVPDERVGYLSSKFNPKKTIYAQLELVDIPGIDAEAVTAELRNAFLASIRSVDALIVVIKAFRDPANREQEFALISDLEQINIELLLSDLDMIEKRILRIETGKKKNDCAQELKILRELQEVLGNEKRIDQIELAPEDKESIRGYGLLTEKPMIVVVNIDEQWLASGDYPGSKEFRQYCQDQQLPLIELSAQIENEIRELNPEEQLEFLSDLGIKTSGLSSLARAVYEQLGLISFFTVGEDEVRAWTIEKGMTAKESAGKIHSDLERGFIRAEVISYEDMQREGSLSKLREKGLLRIEGKEYLVQDGDIMSIRFNV